jgi:parallel beta-helix repeat protein
MALAAALMLAIASPGLVVGSNAPVATLRDVSQPAGSAEASLALYVSTYGSNTNPGTLSAPLRSLQRAADLVVPGTTVYVRAGTYTGFRLRRSGTAEAPITFRAYAGETVRIAGDANHQNVVRLVDVHHVVITRLTVEDAPVRKGSGIQVLSSRQVTVTRCVIRQNNSFGVLVERSTNVRVANNAISQNATGVRVRYGGSGVVIAENKIFRNTRMTVNDATPGNDTGGQGIAFEKTSGGAVARDNLIWGNRARSHDYGEDGAAFEIFASSNLTITRNRMWNNRAVLETGTNDLYSCRNNRFTRNVAWRSTTATSAGMVLRCARDMLVAQNTFDNLTFWAMQINHGDGSFGDSVAGLTVLNNIVNRIKSFHINDPLPSSVRLDYNLVWAPDKHVAYIVGHGYTKSLSEFRNWTGYEAHGLSRSPRFLAAGRHNYTLEGGSPAINRGLRGVTPEDYAGTAPDLGRYEYR